MERIVTLPDGQRKVFKGHVCEDAWEVFSRKVAGHHEVSVRNMVTWEETDDVPPLSWDEYISQFEGEEFEKRLKEREREMEERREKKREQNARRAKTACRMYIKSAGLNELLTLTYRDNQEDRALCKRHFKEWARRMKKALGGSFVYVASFEKQDRGAMHVHVACHKLPKLATHKGVKVPAWKVGTAIWRDIVGLSADGKTGGLCFVGGKGNGNKRYTRSIAKIAAYVSKYIMKDFKGSPLESNRYSRSESLEMPKAVRMVFNGLTPAQMIDLVFECGQGDVIVSHRVTRDNWSGCRYWLVTEPDPGGGLYGYEH